MDKKFVDDYLYRLLEIAVQAGEAIMEHYGKADVETTYKEDNSPLTMADLAAHDLIVEYLQELTPNVPILSEESKEVTYEIRKDWTDYWLVDPLDGTKEFIKNSGEFTVNIALMVDRKPFFGVVYAPATGLLYYGLDGDGSYKVNSKDFHKKEKITVSDYNETGLKIVASKSHRSAELEEFLKNIDYVEDLSIGSSLKLCLIAEGKAHLYPRIGLTSEWDTAAAHVIVNNAGGKVVNLRGEELIYNKENILNPFFIVTSVPEYPWQNHIFDAIKDK